MLFTIFVFLNFKPKLCMVRNNTTRFCQIPKTDTMIVMNNFYVVPSDCIFLNHPVSNDWNVV